MFGEIKDFAYDIYEGVTGSDLRDSRGSTGTKIRRGNPYSLFYKEQYGHIFGKPLAFLPRSDPNQRVFQKTMLKNNTIISIVPGVPFQDDEMLEKAKTILTAYDEKYQKIKAGGGDNVEKELDDITYDVRDELNKAGVDLRFAIFKQDIAGFTKAYQLLVSRTGTAIFAGQKEFIRDSMVATSIKEGLADRGFKVWVEKGTSISEAVDNSFTKSVLETTQKEASNIMKQARFIGKGLGMGSAAATQEDQDVVSGNNSLESVGKIASLASTTGGGAIFDFPQIFDSSNFQRSYEISFRFVSPYGDDRSVANHVIFPFLFLLTCALPKQDGPSGHESPFILQVDAPGFFSCPMGVITSFTFRKGGDEMLFNDKGLPLVIEGSMTITDLYSNLSLPLNNGQFATNIGSSAFLANLGGLNLYAVLDMSLRDIKQNWLKSLMAEPLYAYAKINEETYNIMRVLGLTPPMR